MRRRFLSFLKKQDAIIAVEFAFIAPVMLGFFFGLTQLALALNAKAAVINLTSAGADLVAQKSAATTTDMTNVFSAMTAMLFPYSATPAKITITSIIDNNTATTGKVAWSCTKGGTARVKDAVYTFPTAAQGVITQGGGGSVIMAEVSYSYSLPFTVTVPGVMTLSGPYAMTNTFYAKPRRVAQIPMGTCPP